MYHNWKPALAPLCIDYNVQIIKRVDSSSEKASRINILLGCGNGLYHFTRTKHTPLNKWNPYPTCSADSSCDPAPKCSRRTICGGTASPACFPMGSLSHVGNLPVLAYPRSWTFLPGKTGNQERKWRLQNRFVTDFLTKLHKHQQGKQN